MLDTLIAELESYTDENFAVANLAVSALVFLRLYHKGHMNKDTLFAQIDSVIRTHVDKNNNNEIVDKVKLDSLLYRIREWLER